MWDQNPLLHDLNGKKLEERLLGDPSNREMQRPGLRPATTIISVAVAIIVASSYFGIAWVKTPAKVLFSEVLARMMQDGGPVRQPHPGIVFGAMFDLVSAFTLKLEGLLG